MLFLKSSVKVWFPLLAGLLIFFLICFAPVSLPQYGKNLVLFAESGRNRLVKYLVSVCEVSSTQSNFSDPEMYNMTVTHLMHEYINITNSLIRYRKVKILCPGWCLVCHGWRASLASAGTKIYRRSIWIIKWVFYNTVKCKSDCKQDQRIVAERQ